MLSLTRGDDQVLDRARHLRLVFLASQFRHLIQDLRMLIDAAAKLEIARLFINNPIIPCLVRMSVLDPCVNCCDEPRGFGQTEGLAS
jgi:hypothetical protein